MVDEWEETKELLSYIDVMVDGEFMADKKDLGLAFKGSSNQRTILVQESLVSGMIVYWGTGNKKKITRTKMNCRIKKNYNNIY